MKKNKVRGMQMIFTGCVLVYIGVTLICQINTPHTSVHGWTITDEYTGEYGETLPATFVGHPWRITWSCDGIAGNSNTFIVAVYTVENATLMGAPISTTCTPEHTHGESTPQTTYGPVYFTVISQTHWILDIQEYY